MRRTVHLIAAEDAGWLLPLFAEAIVRWSRKRLADFGLDRRGQDRALKVLHDAVDAEGAADPAASSPSGSSAPASRPRNEFKVHLWLLATLDGELCLGPDRGGQTCLVRTADWIGELEPRPRDDSLAELARRYLRAYGPATSATSPAGPGCRCATRGSGSSGSPASSRAGRRAVHARQPAARRAARPSSACSAPSTTTTSATSTATSPLAAEHEKRSSTRAAASSARRSSSTGAIVGTWSSKRSGKRLAVAIEPFEPLDAGDRGRDRGRGRRHRPLRGPRRDARLSRAATIPRR